MTLQNLASYLYMMFTKLVGSVAFSFQKHITEHCGLLLAVITLMTVITKLIFNLVCGKGLINLFNLREWSLVMCREGGGLKTG